MPADIDIQIRSRLDDAGFARALRAIRQLQQEIGKSNAKIISSFGGKGGLGAYARDVEQGAQAAERAAKRTTRAKKESAQASKEEAAAAEASTSALVVWTGAVARADAAARQFARTQASLARSQLRGNTGFAHGAGGGAGGGGIPPSGPGSRGGGPFPGNMLPSGPQIRALASGLDDYIEASYRIVQNARPMAQGIAQAAQQVQRSTSFWQRFGTTAQAAGRLVQSAMRGAAQATQTIGQQAANATRRLAPFIQNVQRLAQALANGLVRATRNAAASLGSLARSAGARFATMQRTLAATGRAALGFGRDFDRGMSMASSALDRTAAGWSLLMAGFTLRNVGTGLLRGGGLNLADYLSYERAVTRTAISGSTDKSLIDELVFGMARGEILGQKIGNPVYGFSAEELAQGTYYLTSAIGLPLSQQNLVPVAEMLLPMLQVAQYTMTTPEAAIKGALNIGMEFGYNPRDMAQSKTFANIAAMMGYMANVSTMEVTDLVETFKMVGPTFNQLSGGAPGAGLTDMFVAAFLASEVGLRGSKVGAGLQRLGSSLYDPTDKMLGLAAEAFGIAPTREAWYDFFFDPSTGGLKGGFGGFLETFMAQGEGLAADALLAQLFTENATRNISGMLQRLRQSGSFQAVIDELLVGNYDKALELLTSATEKTNETVFGAVGHMKLGWMDFTNSLVESVKGPLMDVLNGIGEAFHELADILDRHPFIGKFIAGLAGSVGVLLSVVGTILTMAGTVLILQRAFLFTSGAANLFIGILAAIPHLLALGLPLMLALAAAAVALKTAWDANFLGIRDTVDRFSGDFSRAFQEDILPQMADAIIFARRTAAAFQELVGGIMLGVRDTNNLGAWLELVFGGLLGPRFYARALDFQEVMGGVRQSIVDFVTGARDGMPSLRDVHRSIQMFFEEILLGFSQTANREAAMRLGDALGITNLGGKIIEAARAIRRGLSEIVAYWRGFRRAMQEPLEGIAENLDRIFSADTLRGFVEFLRGLAGGFVAGIGSSLLLIANGIEEITRAVANLGNAGRWIADQIEAWTNFRLTLEGVGQTIGAVLGTMLVNRLLLAIAPIRALLSVAITLSVGLVNLGVQASLAAARLVLAGVAAAATALQFLLAQGAVLGLATVLALVAAGIVAYIGYTQGLDAAIAAATEVANGFMAVMSRIITVITVVGGVVLALGQAFLDAVQGIFGFKGELEALGAVIALLVGVWLGSMLIGALGRVTVAFGLAGLGANKFTLTLAGIGVAIAALGPHFDSLFGWFSKANDMAGGWLDEAAIGAAVVGPGNIKKGGTFAGKLAKTVALLAMRNPYVTVPALMLLGTAYVESQIEPMDIYSDDTDFRSFTSQSFQSYTHSKPAMDYRDRMLSDIGNLTDPAQIEAITREAGYNELRAWMVNFGVQTGRLPHRDQVIGLASERFGYAADDPVLVQMMDQLYATVPNTLRTIQAGAAYNLNHTAMTGAGYLDQTAKDTEKALKQSQSVAERVWGEFQTLMDKLGIGKPMDDLFDMVGIDPEKGDFNPEKFFENTAFAKFNDSFDDFLGPEMSKFLTDMEKWQRWQETVEAYGPLNARKLYQMEGLEIPTKPMLDQYDGLVEGLEEIQQKEMEALQKLEEISALNDQATAALQQGFDLPTALDFRFSGDKGPGFINIGSAMAMYAEQIAQNIPEGANWSNIYEGIMDTIGHGADMAANMYGKNLHTVLRNSKGFQNWAAEMGTTVDELLKDVPKFVHAEEYVPMAFAGIAEAMSQVSPAMYEKLDHLGTEMGKIGIEWFELSQYAVSKAMAGQSWNLVDYIAEAWDMSVEEAAQYLISHGIDPTIITDALFPELDLAVMSQSGKVNVFTPEWYDWFVDVTKNGTDKIIEVTRDQFDAIPDNIKISMSAMGYSFVVGAQQVSADALSSYEAIKTAIEDSYPKLKEPLEEIGRITDNFGNEWVQLRDETGEVIEIPAPVYDAYKKAVEEIIRLGRELRENTVGTLAWWHKKHREWMGETGQKDVSFQDYQHFVISPGLGGVPLPLGQPDSTGETAPELPKITPQELGLPTSDEVSKVVSEGIKKGVEEAGKQKLKVEDLIDEKSFATLGEKLRTAFEQALTGSQDGESAALIDPKTLIDVNAFATLGQQAMASFVGGFSSGAAPAPTPGSTLTGEQIAAATGSAGPFDSVFAGYAESAVRAFREKVNELLPSAVSGDSLFGLNGVEGGGAAKMGDGPFDSTFRLYAQSAVEQFKTTLNNALPEATTSLTDLTKEPFKVTLELVADEFFAILSMASLAVTTFDALEPSVTLGIVADSFFSIMSMAMQALTTFDQLSATATISVEDNATSVLNSALAALNTINGYVATASITTTVTTVTRTVNQDTVPAFADGGIVRSPLALVGDEGPELVSLPWGSRVHTASETIRLLRSMNYATEARGGGGSGDGGDLILNFNGDLHFHNEADIDMLVERIDRLQGKKNRKAARGMTPVDVARLHATT